MKIIAQAKWVKIAPRKLGRVAEVVRGKLALEALQLLKFMPQKGARILEKVIKSAVANAKNNYKLAEESLIVNQTFVNKGITMKRWQPRARGRIFPIFKRTSHVTVWLGQKESSKKTEQHPKEAS
ncbi:MAG: 50S ribosomal protein L22 [Candidatus Margulisbacteria bacterium]|nr:50S ribosomal protein L22 [Candidatus Margulisiibacteriota bacterium]